MFNVFGFLRRQARDAVLGGVSDALAEVATDEKPADLDGLRKMLADAGSGTRALPAAKADGDEAEPEPTGRRKK